MSIVKNLLKKILPPPVNSFMREVDHIVAIEKQNQKLIIQLKEQTEQQNKQIELLKQQNEQIIQYMQGIKMDARAARNHAWQSQRTADEVLWGEIYNNTVSDSNWLKNKAFSPGRWAVGYQYLYAVYRILNEVKPKAVLELGLGQSTKLLSQYAASDEAVKHIVVEHDPEWIQFFQQDFQLSENSEIVQLERVYKNYREDDKVLAFDKFEETFAGQKFDFISIDAPLGGEAIIYARVDILDLIPECLADSFIIVVDDCNRQGEQRMVAILEEKLQQKAVGYAKGVYSGKKDCIVICSENLKFVCSM